MKDKQFTQDWFSRSIPAWDHLLAQLKTHSRPLKVLEVGVFEGRSTCWLLENHCREKDALITVIDTFAGGVEHESLELGDLRSIFEKNVRLAHSKAAVEVFCGFSSRELCRLVTLGRSDPGYDFISIDASHQATDVLADCVIAFQLLRRGGLMALDDYLWSLEDPLTRNPLNSPKIAIDAFANIFSGKSRIVPDLPLYQLFIQKL
jgi:predicted O-methyltransferase YrrM